jgi:hypothetical protein
MIPGRRLSSECEFSQPLHLEWVFSRILFVQECTLIKRKSKSLEETEHTIFEIETKLRLISFAV